MTANMRYNLDLTRSGVQVSIDAYQGDTSSRKVLFTLSNGAIPYEPTKDTVAVVYALKPDGKKIENRCAVTSDGIEVDLTSQFTKIAGTVSCQLVLYCDNVIIASPEFTVKVRERWSFPVYEPLISEPDDWETNYSTYYSKNDGGFYESVAGDSAPIWEDGKYYRLSNPTAESENEYGALLSVLAKAEEMFERSLKYAMMIETGATKEDISNKITAISEESTDTQYPSAGAVYRACKALLDALGQKADKTLIEQAAAGEENRLIISDGNGKLVPSEYDINNLRILNNAISGIQKVLLETERLSNKTTSISEESTDIQYPSAKAVYDFVTRHDLLIGHFANYENADLRYSGEEWQVYIRQTASDRVCLRLVNSAIIASTASRILYLYLMGDQRYVIQINNDAQKGFMDYRVEGSETALSAGATDWWFDSENGYIELSIDTSAVAGIAQTREFTIVSALVIDYSWNRLAEVKRVYFHLEDLLTDAALRKVFGTIASATTVKQIADAAKSFIDRFGGA